MDTGGPEASQVVDQLLDEIQELAERTHNHFTLLRVLSMRAVWLARQGESAAARQTLLRALRLGCPGGFIHTFVIRGPEMLELLQAVSPQLKMSQNWKSTSIQSLPHFRCPSTPTTRLPTSERSKRC